MQTENTKQAGARTQKYTFHFDGIDKIIVVFAAAEKEGRKKAWRERTDWERDNTASIELIEVE